MTSTNDCDATSIENVFYTIPEIPADGSITCKLEMKQNSLYTSGTKAVSEISALVDWDKSKCETDYLVVFAIKDKADGKVLWTNHILLYEPPVTTFTAADALNELEAKKQIFCDTYDSLETVITPVAQAS